MTAAMYVCGAPTRTYGSDAIPEELRGVGADIRGVDPGRFGIRTVQTVFGSSRYRWPASADRFIMPDEFTAGLEGFYTAIAQKVCPASVLIEIRGAIVARNVIYCSDGSERRTLYETARPGDRDAVEQAPDAELDGAERTLFDNDSWNCFYLGSAGSSNYGHWLVDDLPRIKAAASLMHCGGKPLRVVLPGYATAIDRIRMDSIRALVRAPVHIDLIDPYRPQYFPRLFYVTPVSEHPVAKSPLAMDYAAREILSSLYAGAAVREDGQTRRIFVRRRPGQGRALLNEDALLPYLLDRDFEIVDTHDMPFAQQAKTFAQAGVVVGAMGAAMANTLFCRPQTQVIHIAPKGWIEPFYLDLSVTRGHSYRVLYGDVDDTGRAPHLSDYTIAIDALLGAIDAT